MEEPKRESLAKAGMLLPEASTFEPGQRLDDRIELLEIVGTGAMGVVYKARQQGVDRAVAVKTLHSNVLADKDSVARFLREAKLIGTLNHPNIVRLYTFGLANEHQPYMVMDFVKGETLADLIQQKKLNGKQFLEVFTQVASALSHAHKQGIVHRDIKPRNILIEHGEDGSLNVKLADFGIARLAEPNTVPGQKITKTGAIIGSPMYMSPEQCTGRAVDQRTDIYSLGCVMYETATGKAPFKDEDALGLIGKHCMETPVPVDGKICVKGLNKGISKIISVAMQKNPEDRYQDANVLYCDLMSLMDGKAPPVASKAKIVALPPSVEKKKKNSRIRLMATIAVSIILIAGIVVARNMGIGTEPEKPTRSTVLLQVNQLYERAQSEVAHRNNVEALNLFSKANELCRENNITDQIYYDICVGRARCEFALGNFTAANTYFVKALNYYELLGDAHRPTFAALLFQYGESLLNVPETGDYKGPAEILERAWMQYQIVPIDSKYRIKLLRLLIKAERGAGRKDKALQFMQELLAVEKSYGMIGSERAKTHEMYAKMLEKDGDFKGAAQQLQLAKLARQEQKKDEDKMLSGD